MGVSRYMLLTIFYWKLCIGIDRFMMLEKLPNNATLEGLGCAIQQPTTGRGWKFDLHTDICSTLQSSWFASPIFEPASNYFKLKTYETPFKRTDSVDIPFPQNFVTGGSVVVFIETETVIASHTMDIAITTNNSVTIPLGMASVASNNYTSYNAFINGSWGPEERANQFLTSNTIYQLKFLITEEQVEIIVDDVPFHNFTQRVPASDFQWFVYKGTSVYCTRVQFTYPD